MSSSNTTLPRYDFVYFFDVTDGNPNGDPDAGNLPRVDPETGQGLVTDVCLKRKIRNYVALTHDKVDRYHIFVKERAVLNELIEEAYSRSDEVAQCVAEWEAYKKGKGKKDKSGKTASAKPSKAYEDIARDWMCHNYFDVRTFGAVMSTGDEKAGKDEEGEPTSKMKRTAGQVRGPMQFAMGRSIDPIFSQEHAITRCAVTNEKDLEKQRTMGRKFTVPYGLYRVHGFFNPYLADQTKFSAQDLELFKTALGQMFEYDRSAARGQMVPRRCIAFRHDSALGNARADQLFARVGVKRATASDAPPRSFQDYTIDVSRETLPAGVTIEEWV